MDKRLQVSTSRSACLLVVAAAWALFLALTGSPEAVLFTVPVFLLAAPLAFGRYVGEEKLAALRRTRFTRTGRMPATVLADLILVPLGRIALPALPGRGPPPVSL